jgi:hypothetical protein
MCCLNILCILHYSWICNKDDWTVKYAAISESMHYTEFLCSHHCSSNFMRSSTDWVIFSFLHVLIILYNSGIVYIALNVGLIHEGSIGTDFEGSSHGHHYT